MKDDELNILLSGILTELKEVNKDKELELLTLESIHLQVGSIVDQLEKIPTKTPEINLDKLLELLKYSHNEIIKAIQNQPKEVIHEKRILLYPEGDGKKLVKDISLTFIKVTAIVFSIYLIINLGLDYYQKRSVSEKYKYSYIWIYWKGTKDTKKYLNEVYSDFNNDSIYYDRKNQIDNLLEDK